MGVGPGRVFPRLTVAVVALLPVGCADSDSPQLVPRQVTRKSIPSAGSTIPAPRAVTTSPDNTLYLLDNAGRVLVFDRDGNSLRQWNMPESDVGNPEGICVLSDGNIAVADTHYHRVVVFDDVGQVQRMIGQEGQGDGDFFWPVAVIEDDRGHRFVSAYGGATRVQKCVRAGEDPAATRLLGDIDGTAVGYGLMTLRTVVDGSLHATVEEIFVLPGARAGGVGEASIEALLADARERGAAAISLSRDGNTQYKILRYRCDAPRTPYVRHTTVRDPTM